MKPRARGVFIAGTDTGVGKTLVAGALLYGLAGRGISAVGMKPVAAGAVRRRGQWINEDVELLRAASNVEVSRTLVNPYCFAAAVAPHIAAAEAGVIMRWLPIRRAYSKLAARAEVVVVEGVGGVLVPLGPHLSAVDIPLKLGLPVILVVGLRLGCINHALLSVEVLRGRGVRLAGWVGSQIDPAMARLRQNVDSLRHRIHAPLLGLIPHLSRADPARASESIDFDSFAKVF